MTKKEQIEEMTDITFGRVPISKAECLDVAGSLYAAGYRKLPERPKVLTANILDAIWQSYTRFDREGIAALIAQAQLEADIKHIWGE
jgi:hypothetical protein